MHSCLNCPRQTRKRNAKSVFFTGIKASFIALARISWKKAKPAEAPFQCTLDHLSIPNYVIKKGRLHGHRYGKTTARRDHFIAHNLRKRCIKKLFSRDPPSFLITILNFMHLNSTMIEMKWSVSRWMPLAQKEFSHHMTQAEHFRYRRNWWISLNNSRTSGPLKNRSEFNDGVVHITPSTPRIWWTTTQASAILEQSILAPIIEFFLQLVAMERYLVELIITQWKVHTWTT